VICSEGDNHSRKAAREAGRQAGRQAGGDHPWCTAAGDQEVEASRKLHPPSGKLPIPMTLRSCRGVGRGHCPSSSAPVSRAAQALPQGCCVSQACILGKLWVVCGTEGW
jgi:hypothetical protein